MKQDTYTHGHGKAAVDSHRRRNATNSAGYLLPHLTREMSLLDVGCETGTITADFANYVGSVTGLDVDSASVKRAAAEFPAVKFLTGSIYELPFPDNTFDVVHAHQVLQHLTDPVKALTEMVRIAKPSGLIACRDADYRSMVWYPESPRLDDWLRVYRLTARSNAAEPDAGSRLIHWAHAAGLTDVICSSSSAHLTADAATQWGERWAARTLDSTYVRQVLDSKVATEDELRQIADAWLDWAKAEDKWFGMVHGEIIAKKV